MPYTDGKVTVEAFRLSRVHNAPNARPWWFEDEVFNRQITTFGLGKLGEIEQNGYAEIPLAGNRTMRINAGDWLTWAGGKNFAVLTDVEFRAKFTEVT